VREEGEREGIYLSLGSLHSLEVREEKIWENSRGKDLHSEAIQEIPPTDWSDADTPAV
jgi:hypothetical protein